MAADAVIERVDMVDRFTRGKKIVVTSKTCIDIGNLLVIHSHGKPTDGVGMTAIAGIARGHMINRLASSHINVVAAETSAEHLIVIYPWHRVPNGLIVATVALLAGVDMIDRFRRGADAAVDAVTADAGLRRTGELAADMTTFAGGKLVASGQLKAGIGVIEQRTLRVRQARSDEH